MRETNGRRWKGEEDVDGWWVEGRLCLRGAFNPQKHPDGSCSVQMGMKQHARSRIHAHSVRVEKKDCQMLEPLSYTLEDHA